jgi:hypothetical protein
VPVFPLPLEHAASNSAAIADIAAWALRISLTARLPDMLFSDCFG